MSHSVTKTVGAAIVALCMSGIAAKAAPAFTTLDLNLRGGPGAGFPVIATMPGGSQVEVGECQGSWCAVYWRGYQGYASASYLDFAGYAPAQPSYTYAPQPYAPYYYDPYPRGYSRYGDRDDYRYYGRNNKRRYNYSGKRRNKNEYRPNEVRGPHGRPNPDAPDTQRVYSHADRSGAVPGSNQIVVKKGSGSNRGE